MGNEQQRNAVFHFLRGQGAWGGPIERRVRVLIQGAEVKRIQKGYSEASRWRESALSTPAARALLVGFRLEQTANLLAVLFGEYRHLIQTVQVEGLHG